MDVHANIRGPVDVAALQAALHDVVRKHEILRTSIHEIDDIRVQRVRELTDAEDGLRIVRGSTPWAFLNATPQVFDLRSELPIRAYLASKNRLMHWLGLAIHPAAIDAWSVRPLLLDLNDAYAARRQGTPLIQEELTLQYADYSLWQRDAWATAGDPASRLGRQLQYWTRALENSLAPINLPVDEVPGTDCGYQAQAVQMRLNPVIHHRCNRVARNAGTTLLTVLHTALAVLMSRQSAASDVCIATMFRSRLPNALDSLVGAFASPMLLRIDVAGNPTFQQLLRAVHNVAEEAASHYDLPFYALMDSIGLPAEWNSFARIMLTLRGEDHRVAAQAAEIRIEGRAKRIWVGRQCDLSMELEEHGEGRYGIDGTLYYNRQLFHRDTIETLICRFAAIVADAVANPDTRIGDLAVESDRLTARHTKAPTDGERTRQSLSVRPNGLQRYALGNATAARLVAIWEKLLGLQGISILDNLADLDGGRALHRRGLAAIAQWCGERLPLSRFANGTTIALLTEELVRRVPSSLIRQIQTGDAKVKPPFFLLHGDIDGGGYYTFDLLSGIERDQPVYVLHPHGATIPGVPASIEEMAEDYIGVIRRIQPRGPYHLGGYCNAGLVAFEMGRRLREAGERVEAPILICSTLHSHQVSNDETAVAPTMTNPSVGDSTVMRHASAAHRYTPQPYRGSVVLVWPREAPYYHSPDACWRDVCESVELQYTRGSHSTCIRRDIAELAAVVNRCLTAAHRARSESHTKPSIAAYEP
jgi:hypothetical protein